MGGCVGVWVSEWVSLNVVMCFGRYSWMFEMSYRYVMCI